MSAVHVVDEMINAQMRGGFTPKKVFLEPRLYLAFLTQIEPWHRGRYGALIVDDAASRGGFDNVLYRGVAICVGGVADKPLSGDWDIETNSNPLTPPTSPAPTLPQDGRSKPKG